MEDGIYVAFLVGVGRNSATFGTYTHYKRPGEGQREIRIPSILPAAKTNAILDEIDRDPNQISDWRSLYRWLGRDTGTWASFTQESALHLLPHWFSESTEFDCKSIAVNGNGPFLDARSSGISREELGRFRDIAGTLDTANGEFYTVQTYSNLVITTLPVFSD